jgi:hypothetical protein
MLYKIDLLWKTLTALERPGRARTVERDNCFSRPTATSPQSESCDSTHNYAPRHRRVGWWIRVTASIPARHNQNTNRRTAHPQEVCKLRVVSSCDLLPRWARRCWRRWHRGRVAIIAAVACCAEEQRDGADLWRTTACQLMLVQNLWQGAV